MVISAIKKLTTVGSGGKSNEEFDLEHKKLEDKISRREGTISGKYIHRVNSSMLISGGPGAGKTTLLRKLTMYYAANNDVQRPIFLRAIDLNGDDAEKDILDFAHKTLVESDIRINKRIFVSKIKKGEFKLFIDGIDEAGEHANKVINAIIKISNQYPSLSIVASCRETIEWPEWPLSLYIQLKPFSKKQLDTFIDNWFNCELESARSVKHWIEQAPNIKESVKIPLFAALLCSLYAADADLPSTKTELFSGRLDLLLGKWEQAKGLSRMPKRYRLK